MNLFLLVCDVFLFVFWKRTPQRHFEIPFRPLKLDLSKVQLNFRKHRNFKLTNFNLSLSFFSLETSLGLSFEENRK
jgi:hypothetical protein